MVNSPVGCATIFVCLAFLNVALGGLAVFAAVSVSPQSRALSLSRQHGAVGRSQTAFLTPRSGVRLDHGPLDDRVANQGPDSGPKRPQSIASQKHVLEKERYIRRKGPSGFGSLKAPTPEPTSNKGKEFADEFKRDFPNATLKQLWEVFNYTGPIRKGVVSGRLLPSKGAVRPNYYKTGIPKYVEYLDREEYRSEEDPRGTIKNASEIEGIRKACRIAREILDSVKPLIVEGVFTDDIDRMVHKMCHIKGVFPSPLNYHGFPKSVCTSINEIACHGIPDSTILSAGDLLNVDVTIYVDGFHGDVSETFMVLPSDDPKRVANRKIEIGMYERNKMRYYASMHDNVRDSGPTVMLQLNFLRMFDAGVRLLGPKDGWEQLFERMYTEDKGRKPLFLSKKENDLMHVGRKLSSDVEPLYVNDSPEQRYDGRIVGLQSAAIPTYVAPPGHARRFMTLEHPEVISHIFQKLDPERPSKPWLFSHTFDEDVELMKITYEALMKAISICAPGVRVSEIGRVISEYVEERGCHSLPNLVGHGIGRNFHENPLIPHTVSDSEVVMEPGMVFTIEPVVTRSKETEFVMWPDGWTVATKDGKKTAQFEHTILITDTGHEILTKRLPSSPKLYWEDPIKVKW